MTVAQPDQSVVSPRLHRRLSELGVTVLCMSSDGRSVPIGGSRWIERQIIASPRFITAVRRQWETLCECPGGMLDIWPGVTLTPLPSGRRSRPLTGVFQAQQLVALFVGPALLESEQLRGLCDSRGMDTQATLDRIDGDQLHNPEQARRLAATLTWMREDDAEIERRVGELHGLSRELTESYEELSLLYKLSSNMAVNQPPETFLNRACRELREVASFDGLAILLSDDEPRLKELAGRAYTTGSLDIDEATMRHIGRRLLEAASADSEPRVVDDTAVLDLPQLHAIASSVLIVPLMFENRPLGIIVGADKTSGEQITSVDANLCKSLANSLSVFLENVMLYHDMQTMFLGTLRALTAAIDAKDSYTRGHSERVALASRLIARKAGLDESLVERIYIAALVHDVGKIGVPEAVLCKPGRLTSEEFDQIKRHPEIGARILQDIRQMDDLIPGVLYHHERWDGRGYPHGLVGEQTPLMGRVIGLADAFDAMSSDRTYRRAMGLDQVLTEIEDCSGTQFDPELAKLMAKIDFTSFYKLMEKHRDHQFRRSA